MFDVYVTILNMYQTVEHCRRSPGRFVVEFWVFIDWSHPNIPHTHTHHDAQRSPHDFLFPSFGFVSEFCVCCRVLGFHRLITSEHSTHTHHDARRPPHDFSFLSFPGINFRETIFPGTIFPRTNFPGTIVPRDHFSRGPFLPGTIFPRTIFSGDHFSGIQSNTWKHFALDISRSSFHECPRKT